MKASQIIRKLESNHPEGLTRTELFLASEDLLPVTEEKKTWDWWNFVRLRSGIWLTHQVSFWIADSFNLNTFTIASSMIAAGLTWWQALICVILGYSLVGPLLVLNARPGAIHGITFPAVNRTTFGLFGSLWPVFNRESRYPDRTDDQALEWPAFGGEFRHGSVVNASTSSSAPSGLRSRLFPTTCPRAPKPPPVCVFSHSPQDLRSHHSLCRFFLHLLAPLPAYHLGTHP